MRLCLLIVFICLIGTIINAAFIRSFAPGAITPDFALILTVAVALYYYNPAGALASFLIGLLVDFSSAQFIGPNAAGCVLAFSTVGLIANRMYAEKWIAVMIITIGCSLVKSATYLGLISLYFPAHAGESLWRVMVGESLLTALFSPIIIGIVRRQIVRPASFGKTTQNQLGASGVSSARWSPGTRLHWT